jgi:hypothetical protein
MVLAFHPLADDELNDAANYDERESEGLGAAFILEEAAQRGSSAIDGRGLLLERLQSKHVRAKTQRKWRASWIVRLAV